MVPLLLHRRKHVPQRVRFDVGVCIFWFVMFVSANGCRAFVHHKSNSQLVAARQLSLRGTEALERAKNQDAEVLFSEALKNSPLDERAHWGYSTTLWNRGDRKRSIEHMREALRLSGKNPQYAIRLGEMTLETGDWKSARETALGILSANRNQAQAWALLGDTHQAERDWPAAMECYQRALLIQSDYPRVQLSVAEIYQHTGRPLRALAALDRMTDLRTTASSDPELLLVRGQSLADLNRNFEAAEALAKASDRMPVHRVDRQIQLVRAQHRIGELVPARITLGKLLAQNAANPEVTRLQSMLDMSFADMADPTSHIRKGNGVLVSSPTPWVSPLMNASTNTPMQAELTNPVRR
jgi:tetratricopeptide (TPR) repeat protein